MTELLLFEAARAELIDKVIRPASKEGEIILCDRFYDSTLAYQGFGREMNTDDIRLLNRLATGGIKPDLTFYFHVSLNISKQRSSNRNLDRMESAGDDFFLRVIEGFNKLAADEPERVIKIDASREISDVSDDVICELKKIL
jgi:dTMP kinase